LSGSTFARIEDHLTFIRLPFWRAVSNVNIHDFISAPTDEKFHSMKSSSCDINLKPNEKHPRSAGVTAGARRRGPSMGMTGTAGEGGSLDS